MREVNHITDRDRMGVSPWRFLAVFVAVFFTLAVLLFMIDFVPEAPGSGAASQVTGNAPASLTATAQRFPLENPVRIVAPAVGIDAPILNPAATDIAILNDALLSGAVRYPESGLLGDVTRMYIFGHQSYLPVVHNQAFKAFNGLQNLRPGDEIIVYSQTAAYYYRVMSVAHVTADTGTVALGGNDRRLTLTTCDSFGTKEDRYEVEAEFIRRNPIS